MFLLVLFWLCVVVCVHVCYCLLLHKSAVVWVFVVLLLVARLICLFARLLGLFVLFIVIWFMVVVDGSFTIVDLVVLVCCVA